MRASTTKRRSLQKCSDKGVASGDLQEEADEPVLRRDVQRAIDAGELPPKVKFVLLDAMKYIAQEEALRRWMVKQDLMMAESSRSLQRMRLPTRNRLKREVQSAKAFLSSVESLLAKVTTEMKHPNDPLPIFEIKRQIDLLEKALDKYSPPSRTKRAGAPGIPRHFFEKGVEAVLAMEQLGVARAVAARLITACLSPYLPLRGQGKRPFLFSAKLLLSRCPKP
jgi:hypothetical protein